MNYTKEFYKQLADKLFREVNPFGESFDDEEIKSYVEELAVLLENFEKESPVGLTLETLGLMVSREGDENGELVSLKSFIELDEALFIIAHLPE